MYSIIKYTPQLLHCAFDGIVEECDIIVFLEFTDATSWPESFNHTLQTLQLMRQEATRM